MKTLYTGERVFTPEEWNRTGWAAFFLITGSFLCGIILGLLF